MKNQLFTYNEGIKSWYNEITKHSIQLGGGHNAIIKSKFKNDPEFQWNIVNCDDFKELPKSHTPGHDSDSGGKGDRDIRGHDEEEEEDEIDDGEEEKATTEKDKTRHNEKTIEDENASAEDKEKETSPKGKKEHKKSTKA